MGGADSVQSSGYQIIFDLETKTLDSEHSERSLRMARNTSHILALESMLGVVQDPAFGSYHLENLTHHYASSAWEMMRTYDKEQILSEAKSAADSLLLLMKNRKMVLAGINDYADVKEVLLVKPEAHGFRVARDFENLRLKVSSFTKKPEVQIVLHGDHAALSPRINFAKNYFEILGLKVNESTISSHSSADVIIACSTDEGYSDILPELKNLKAPYKFIAGKTQVDGFTPIFSGQDVYAVLSAFVQEWGNK
jgi:methylmalonyl-CoA mutase